MNRGISSIFLLKALVTSFFKNVIARSDEGAVANHEARQSLKIKQNPKGLLRRPSGTPRNDVLDGLYRSSLLRIVALAAITLLGDGCSSPNEPSITPPQPSFTA